MHREILGLCYQDGKIGDHKRSGDTLDNRRNNLRVTNMSGNAKNARIRDDNTSGHKGVRLHVPNGKWMARIQFNGKRISLGYFVNKDDAGRAYRDAAKEYHGEFARTE